MVGMDVDFDKAQELSSLQVYCFIKPAFPKNRRAQAIYMLGPAWRRLDIIEKLEGRRASGACHPGAMLGHSAAPQAAGLDISATEALNALKYVRVVDFSLGDGATKRSVTRPTQRAASVLRAVGVASLDPPTPPRPNETVI
jgi:hypothetical protein